MLVSASPIRRRLVVESMAHRARAMCRYGVAWPRAQHAIFSGWYDVTLLSTASAGADVSAWAAETVAIGSCFEAAVPAANANVLLDRCDSHVQTDKANAA